MTDIPIRAQLLTVRQVSIIIQVHPNTVLNYLAAGDKKLRAHNPNGDKKGLRITVDSLREYLKAYLLESFDEKTFEAQIDQATAPQHPKAPPARRTVSSGWVGRW